jgi:hypothetical protein
VSLSVGRGAQKKWPKEFSMDKDYFNILVLDHTPFGIRCLRIQKETFKILFGLLLISQLSITFFLCDYIQVKKKQFSLDRLRQESQIQRFQIQLFSAKVEELEKKLSKLNGLDRKIRLMANLERGPETIPFIGMGGPLSSVNQEKPKEETKTSNPAAGRIKGSEEKGNPFPISQ